MKTQFKKDEKIILVTKPHWLTLAVPFVIMLTGSIIGFLIGSYGMLLALVVVCYFIYKIIQRNNNIWVVTDTRVIDEYGVFSNNTKESPLDENPKKLKDTITLMQEEYKGNQIKKQATELASAIIAGQQYNKIDVSSELEKLYELKQKGILTEEEYNNRKTKILNS
ncbi:MAG: SHOCT domain-containing protein [Bacteroidia bacterium]|nr:SHOCT domain-containing protein [Bacteroidia bacterium]